MKYIVTLIISTFFFYGTAQENMEGKNWNVIYSPSAFINDFPGIQIGIERKIKKFAVELEAAYLSNVFDIEQEFVNQRGFRDGYRIKLGVKYKLYDAMSINIIGFYRKTYHDEIETFSMFSGAYFQEIEFSREKSLIGPTLGCTYYKKIWKNISIELGGSTGIGRITVTQSGIPEYAEELESFDNRGTLLDGFDNPGVFQYPIISGQAKIKYNF